MRRKLIPVTLLILMITFCTIYLISSLGKSVISLNESKIHSSEVEEYKKNADLRKITLNDYISVGSLVLKRIPPKDIFIFTALISEKSTPHDKINATNLLDSIISDEDRSRIKHLTASLISSY